MSNNQSEVARLMRQITEEYEAAQRGLTEIMRPAEEAWRRQCEVIDRFQENLDYWKTCEDIGVMITPLSPVK